jgi:hypothetical protein
MYLAARAVRLRRVRDDDLSAFAKWEMDPGRMTTLSNWVALPSEAAAKERIAKWSANEKDDLGFAIETLEDPPVLAGNIHLWGALQGPVRDARDEPGFRNRAVRDPDHGRTAKIESICEDGPAHQLCAQRRWCEPGLHGYRRRARAGLRSVGAVQQSADGMAEPAPARGLRAARAAAHAGAL